MPSTIAYGFACVIVWSSYFSYFWASCDLPSVRDARWKEHWEKLSPIVTGTLEEQNRAYQELKSVDARCVARVVVSIENMQGMIGVIQESINNLQEQARYLANLVKEQNDDAVNR